MKYLALLLCCLLLSGCWVYGSGKSLGYITTVENGIFWDMVYIRAELESSQTDAYGIRKDAEELKNALLKTSELKQRVEIKYKKHMAIAAYTATDEIISFRIID